MARLLKITGVAIFGALIVVAGLVYDIMYAGIPFQDPTPAMQAEWRSNKVVADLLMAFGGLVFLLGVAMMPILWWITRKRPMPKRRSSLDDDETL